MVLILLSIVSFAQAQDQGNISGNSAGNGKYLGFDNNVRCDTYKNSPMQCLPKQQLAWQKKEIAKWKSAVQKAAGMLPRELFDKIGTVSWGFFVDRDDWAIAWAGPPIIINLLPNCTNLPEWLTWEPLGKNGPTKPTRISIALHEIGHLYHIKSGLLDRSLDWIPEENKVTLYSKERGVYEDFAETFALYVMWPEYLKENFPKHYDVIKKILVREYKSVYPMPSSIKSRLTVKEDGKIAN